MYQSQDHKMSNVNASRVRLAARNRSQRTAVLRLCRDGNADKHQHEVLTNRRRVRFPRESPPAGVHGIIWKQPTACCTLQLHSASKQPEPVQAFIRSFREAFAAFRLLFTLFSKRNCFRVHQYMAGAVGEVQLPKRTAMGHPVTKTVPLRRLDLW
jgi:hypothetical protein